MLGLTFLRYRFQIRGFQLLCSKVVEMLKRLFSLLLLFTLCYYLGVLGIIRSRIMLILYIVIYFEH